MAGGYLGFFHKQFRSISYLIPLLSINVGGIAGRLTAMVGGRGSKSVFSLMLMIIFSRPKGVMCCSLPLLRLSAESSASSGQRSGFRGNAVDLTLCVLSRLRMRPSRRLRTTPEPLSDSIAAGGRGLQESWPGVAALRSRILVH